MKFYRNIILIIFLTLSLMGAGVYAAGFNMKRNTLVSVPEIISWEKSGNGFRLHFLGTELIKLDNIKDMR